MQSPETNSLEPRLLGAEPQLYVTNLDAACAFWRDRLGFQMGFVHGDPPFYAQVGRDAARLNLRLAPGPIFAAEFRAREIDALSATIVVENIVALFRVCRLEAAELHQPLRREPWGASTFIVRDPDGNLIAFAGR